MQRQKLGRIILVLLFLILVTVILVYAKPFLVPLTFAAIFATLLLPIARWLEGKGFGKILATLLAVLVLVAVGGGVVWFISWQVSDIASDASKMGQQITAHVQQLQSWVETRLGVPAEQQQKILKQQQSAAPGQVSSVLTNFLGGLGSFLTNLILVLVYIFLFIYFRDHLKRFIIQLVPPRERENATDIIDNAQRVSQQYLTGLALMILCLWVMYGIGFSIIGIKNALFFAVLCGLLEIVPFVGNLTGNLITIGMTLVQGGDTNMVIGIIVTYAIIQFLQTYILEPLVVGAEVNINPLFTIIGIVAGEMVWGIPGMILAIPLLGITKIVCDHIEPLKPYAFLIGNGKKKKGFLEKLKSRFQ